MTKLVKKAVAIALAVVTMAGNGLTFSSTQAAEVEDNIVVSLEEKYEDYYELNEITVFATQELNYGAVEFWQEDMFAIVDSYGNVTEISNKNEDGTIKYSKTSYYGDKGVSFMRPDETWVLLLGDGTWIGTGEKRYTDIAILDDEHFLVCDGKTRYVIDKGENVVSSNIDMDLDYNALAREFNGKFVVELYKYDADRKYYVLDENYRLSESALAIPQGYESSSITDEFIFFRHFDYAPIWVLDKEFNLKQVPTVEGQEVNNWFMITDIYEDAFVIRVVSSVSEYADYCISHETLEVVDATECKPIKDVIGSNSDIKLLREYDKYSIWSIDGAIMYTQEDLDKYFKAKLQVPEDAKSFAVTPKVVTEDKLFIEVYYESSDEKKKQYAVILRSDDGYSLENAECLEHISGGYDFDWAMQEFYDSNLSWVSLTGFINEFDKWVLYINGVELSASTVVGYFGKELYYIQDENEITIYNSDNEAILTTEGEKGNYWEDSFSIKNVDQTTSVYDFAGNEIITTDKNIAYVTEKGILITRQQADGGLYGVIRKKSANEIKLENAEKNETIELDIKKNEAILDDFFKKAKEKDITLVVKTASGATWTINGSDIKDTLPEMIDLNVDVVKDVIPQEAIKSIKLEGQLVELTLGHTGDFGFKAELKLDLKQENKEKYANLFYYNPATKKLEFMESSKIDKDGYADFEYTHASDYAIVISDNEYKLPVQEPDIESDVEQSTIDVVKPDIEAPNTGDSTDFGILMLVSVVTCAVVVISNGRKHRTAE